MICTDFKRKIVGNIEKGCYFKCDAPLKKKTFIIDFYSFIVSSFVQFHECRPNVMACTTKIFQIIGVIFGLVFHELQWQVTRNPDVELLFFFYIVPPPFLLQNAGKIEHWLNWHDRSWIRNLNIQISNYPMKQLGIRMHFPELFYDQLLRHLPVYKFISQDLSMSHRQT